MNSNGVSGSRMIFGDEKITSLHSVPRCALTLLSYGITPFGSLNRWICGLGLDSHLACHPSLIASIEFSIVLFPYLSSTPFGPPRTKIDVPVVISNVIDLY
jgi:hypothetical protein